MRRFPGGINLHQTHPERRPHCLLPCTLDLIKNMANLHTFFFDSTSKLESTSPLSRLIYTGKLPTERGRGCDELSGGVGWTKRGCSKNMHTTCVSPHAMFGEGCKKLTLIEHSGENKPNCFKVGDKLHKVKSHEAGWRSGNPYTSF